MVQENGFFIHQKNKTKQQKLPRRGKTGQLAGLARQDRARQGKARQGKARTGQDRTGHDTTRQDTFKVISMTNWQGTANTRRL